MTFFDISARRLAEEQLRARETRMRLVAESTRDYAIVTTDAEGCVVSWNKGAELVFGYTEEEMLQHDLEPLYVEEDRARGVRQEELRRAREDGRAEDERWHLRKDGSRVYCSGVTTPLGPAATYGYAKIARDQTDRELSNSEREVAFTSEQQNRSHAENEMALKDEFLAIMSHELRHPLNMIHVNAELLARLPEVVQSTSASRAASQVRTAVMSQAKIIEDLLDMSRVRTGKLALALGPVDISAMATAMVDAARADHATQGLAISASVEEEPVVVMADKVRVEQVLMNLLSNAIKFSPQDGTIDIAVVRAGDEACITVSDTGQGIAPDFLGNVFDMFGQSGSVTTRSKGGLGIGLALVREIVQLHGGRAEAASDGIGKGARFSVWLPLYHDEGPACAGNDSRADSGIAGARILVVDDAADVVEVFQVLLEMEGAEVVTATSAQEGLTVLAEHDIDVVISDISMPGMNGYAFLEEARRLPRYTHLPAIALSGLAREVDIARASRAGYSSHLTKPISVDRLLATVHALLPH